MFDDVLPLDIFDGRVDVNIDAVKVSNLLVFPEKKERALVGESSGVNESCCLSLFLYVRIRLVRAFWLQIPAARVVVVARAKGVAR